MNAVSRGRRSFVRLACGLFAAAGAGLVPAVCAAQPAYPEQAVKIIIPFAAGGAVDLVGRPFAQKLSEIIGQPVIIENRAGANTVIGVGAVAKAKPDGYTMLLTTGSLITGPLLLGSVPYDPLRDLVPITQLVYSQGTVLVTRPGFPAKTLAELTAAAKSSPAKFSYAHTGLGTPAHVAAELMARTAGFKLVPVPYKGTGNLLTDIIGGQVDMTFSGIPSALEFIRSGKVGVLASTGVHRSTALLDVPTLQELGFGQVDIRGYYGLWFPAGTRRDRVDFMQRQARAVLDDPSIRTTFEDTALDIIGSSPDEFDAFIRSDLIRQTGIMNRLGLRPSP